MKTKYWILLFGGILAACLGLSARLFLTGEATGFAEITSGGETIRRVDLRIDQELRVAAPQGGYNMITVKDGKIGVTEADCPDHYCMARGMCDSGAQIVCLPNRLVITFVGVPEIDGAAG